MSVKTKPLTALVSGIQDLIRSSRNAAARNVNMIHVMTNIEIGRRIVEHEQRGNMRADYGKMVLKELSERLTDEFGRGFSRSNLEYMRKFYIVYGGRLSQKSQIPSGKSTDTQRKRRDSSASIPYDVLSTAAPFRLSWSQYILLLGISDERARAFYEVEAATNNWTLPELSRQVNASVYERSAIHRKDDSVMNLSRKGQTVSKAEDIIKEPYVLEFLGLEDRPTFSETDLESAIIDKLERFLRELGKGFLFEARQRRFTFDEEHFFIDLVFYNRLLRCYVLIDLKIGKLTHQDLGQMQMYVNYFDRYITLKGERPTVGIILCKEQRDALVEITLPKGSNIFAKQYQLYLPSKNDLQRKLLEWSASGPEK